LLEKGIEVTKKTLKRFLKSLGYSYKRARAKIKKQDDKKFQEAKKEIEHLKGEVAKDDSLNLYFFDESSFSLTPNIPYGWSPKNETIMLEATRSKSLKVLGFLGLDNQLKSYTTMGTIDALFVISIFDDFVEQLPKNTKTIVILDNAPTHTSKLFQAKIEKWKAQGLILYFLPTYSPELNRIEILWRFMKYHWIEIKDYASTLTLEAYVHRILSSYGKVDGLEINFW
jgi:transposase